MTGGDELDLDQHQGQALEQVAAAQDQAALDQARVQLLGRRAPLSEALSGIGNLPPERRRAFGRRANQVKAAIQEAIDARAVALRAGASGGLAEAEAIDLTFPATPVRRGHPHPVSLVMREMEEIFRGLGYEVARGPEVDNDYYSFEALNIPRGHPARDGFDTFFIADPGAGDEPDPAAETNRLLRPHTSPMQVRVMERQAPPIRIVMPGKVYRRDNDATHVPMFHQLEGLLVDEGVTVADLRGTLEYFARAMFGDDRRIRLRPDHFPFTEPSLEVHVSCFVCDGAGCGLCRHSGWIEILGAGMVHPNVLRFGGIDPDRYSGFAFGMGADRVAMLKYGVEDMRHMFDNDLRLVRQF
ncbi:MAG: phenylalanyl-tRNA synthetase alpha chain [Chloroflexota bacterium]|nr:phenylalanyl-tRNA synthetase alpha chain [Chloroflexota bacterium]